MKRLSIIVNFYNMRREAARTLYSLTPAYQRNIHGLDYEVIVLDHGSSEPLEESMVRSFGPQFHYYYIATRSPSPCAALNAAARMARGEWVMICIDGARILSPGIIHYALLATRLWMKPFIYTVGMHLGHKIQNEAMLEGYDQQTEDILLDSVDWRRNGYRLFRIACLASSSNKGFFHAKAESNCFMLSRSDYLSTGGFDEAFQMAGGGLSNLDLFNRINGSERFQPVLLIGEATFHQFHGGAATNVPPSDHPWRAMVDEYQRIRGTRYAMHYRQPACLGEMHDDFEWVLTMGRESK